MMSFGNVYHPFRYTYALGDDDVMLFTTMEKKQQQHNYGLDTIIYFKCHHRIRHSRHHSMCSRKDLFTQWFKQLNTRSWSVQSNSLSLKCFPILSLAAGIKNV